jgi:hypothetical protein
MAQYIADKLLRYFQGAQAYINVAMFHKDWSLASDLLNEVKQAHSLATYQVPANRGAKRQALCCVLALFD